MRTALIFAALCLLVAPLAVGEGTAREFADPVGDERMGGTPGDLERLGLIDCTAAGSDIHATRVARDGADLAVGLTLGERDSPLRCAAYEGNAWFGWGFVVLYGETHEVHVYAHHVWPEPEVYRTTWVVYDNHQTHALHYEIKDTPAADLWDGDAWTLRLPVRLEVGGALVYDLAGETFEGFSRTDARYYFGPQSVQVVDEAEVGRVTIGA